MTLQTFSVVLGGTNSPQKKEREIQSNISRTQEAIPNHALGMKIEVYDFSLSARIPTKVWTTSWFLRNLMGREPKEIIVSPTGGIAVTHYYKPVRELVRDTGSSGGFMGEEGSPDYCKSTDEDTERFWLLRNNEFQEELIEKGWMIFPGFEQMGEHERQRIEADASTSKRKFSLKNLIRTIQLTDNGDIDYKSAIRDLEELSKFGDDMEFVYSGGFYDFFHMPVTYCDNSLTLKINELDSLTDPKRNKDALRRNVYLYYDSSDISGLTPEMQSRISDITRDYLGQNNIGGYVHSSPSSPLACLIRSPSLQLSGEIPEPDTGFLLNRAIETDRFIRNLIKIEKEESAEKLAKLLQKRKNQFGIK